MKKNSHKFYLSFLLLLFSFLLFPLNTFAQSQNAAEVIQRYENGQITKPTQEEKAILRSYLNERTQQSSTIGSSQYSDLMLATFINENFATATVTTPPAGWTQNRIAGDPTFDFWHFDNPGSRTLNAPITSPAAIFDSDWYSDLGGPENVALESPVFSVPAAATVFLEWNQYFLGGFGGEINVEVFNGSSWVNVYTTTLSTPNPDLQSINISTHVAGIANAQVRFRWVGDYSWYWIVDNVKVFSTATGLTGIKNIPGDYATLELAINDLNAQGVGNGGVTLNLLAANPQTAPAGGYIIGGTGSLVLTSTGPLDQVTIQGNGNTITAFLGQTAGNLNDGIFKIIGADWITINNFTMLENPANTITTAGTNDMTEWGVALLYEIATNGAQNNTISNCIIDLNRTYQNTFGIYSNSTHTPTAVTTSASATGLLGGNHGLRIISNQITDVNMGIVVVGPTAAADFNNVLLIGGTAPTGNIITNYGTTGTFSGYANVSATVNGILIRNTINFDASYNTVTSSVGGVTNGTLYGIQVPTFSVAPLGTFTNSINSNIISLRSGVAAGAMNGINCGSTTASTTSTINIINNDFNSFGHTVSGTAAITFILNSGTHLNQNITGNTFTNITVNTTGSVTFISNSTTLPVGGVKNVSNNAVVTQFTKTGAGGTVLFFTDNGSDPAGSTNNSNFNIFSNISVTGATAVTGISNTNGGSPTKNVISNVINNITGGTSAFLGLTLNFDGGLTTVTNNTVTNVTSAGAITGINFGTSGAGVTYCFANIVNGLTGTGTGIVSAIATGGTNTGRRDIYNHNIYNLESNNAGGSAFGIIISSGTINVYNNFISDVRAPICTLATDGVRGISITSTSATSGVRLYYNSIYLNAGSSGANFSSSGIFHTNSTTATTAELDMRNNVVVNVSVPQGTGITVAFRRSAVNAALNNYSTLSNNNDFYAGTPGPANLIFFDGTNADQTIAAFKARVTPRETLSFTENPPFLNVAATPYNLHMNTAIATQTESGGTPVSAPIAVTTDFDNDSRNATSPDVGADEFSGIALDFNPPTIAYTPLGPTSSLTSRTLTSSITDPSGVPTAGIGLPVLYWRINSGIWNTATATYISGNNYQFTFGGGIVLGDTVKYYIVAQDNAVPPNVGAFPSAGAGGFTANPPAAATPPTTPSSYLIVGLPLSGSYTVGTTLFSSITGRDITFQKSVSKVMKEVVVETDAVKGVEYTETSPTVNGVKQLVEVEEISWIPMENGQVYEGDLFVKKAENPSLDFPEGIDGVYLTLTAAITDLNLRGVVGATTFLLTDATYPTETFPMIINVLSENKPTAVNTVTIKPNTAVTASISGPSAASQLLRILNSHIIIDGSNSGGTNRNLTFENTSVTTPQVILIGSLGTTPIINVTVKNCNIINGVNTSTPLIVSDGNAAGTAGWFNNITIQNNTIQKAYIGSYSIAVVSAGNGSGLSLLSNDLTTSGANSVRFVGLYLQGIDGANVSGNQIANFDGVTGEDDRGIWLATGTTNTVVQRNRIYSLKYTGTGGYGAYGAAISTGTLNANNSFINNVVYDISGDGWGSSILGDNPHGIYLFSTQTGIKVYYNSIYLYGNTLNRAAAISTGITLGTGTTADIKDNVIVNNLGALTTLGLASIGIYVQSAATQLEASNYNDIWIDPSGTISKFIGQIGATGYATLLEWQTASTQDANSISANPLFVSNTDLRPSETSPLLLAATPIAGITTDILGATRNATTPTIGAYEMPFYVPLSGTYTVGLSAFLQATGKKIYFETRTRTVRKDLLAEDTNIDLLAYDEKENGSQQPVIDESQRYITVTEEYLEMMENGKPFDQSFFSDNTLGIYPTITAAVADLKLRGVVGPVTFLLVDTNYPTETYPIELTAFGGASATNTVTIKPATGVQAVIPGSTTQTTATLRLNTDGQYYIIDGSNTVSGTTRDLSIIAPAVVPAVHFFSNGSNNVVKNCIIQSQQTSTGSGSLILAAGTASSNNLIDNCLFQPVPSAAVYAIGVYLFSSTLSSNNTISNNEFLNFSARGITMQGAAGVNGNKAVKNLIHQTTPSTATTIYGFYLGRGKNNVVEGNVINNLQSTSATATQYGIYYIGASGDTMIIKIINNVISLSAGVNQTAGTIRGIDYFGYAANSAEIYYNTVYIGGSNVTAGTTAALAKRDDALNFIVKDNTFNNARSNISGTGIHYAVQYTDTVTTLLDMNYNHYYASGNGGVFGIYATTTTANLVAWQTRTSQDANSISNDPIFVSNLDYRPQAVSPLLAAGLTISGITTDILGALRGTPPTIGAYENGVFVAINSPSNLAAIPDTFTVDLSWQDNSNNEFAFVIQRKLGDSLSVNPWNNIDTVNANVINYLDTGLSANTMYSYRVFGYNSSGNSGFSNIVTTTTFIPVELTAFTAELSGREILVSWSTATELNNRGFDIERNMNGEWEKIGFKDGRGTTTTESSYSFIDKFTYESFVGTITYRLKQMDFDGTYAYSPEVEVNVDFTPKEYTLYQNYPNPFNPVTTIKYSLPFESNVRIAVYNILGEMIDVLIDETKQVGFHDFNWNASNLASGIYIYTIEAKSVAGDKNYSSVKKMILMK